LRVLVGAQADTLQTQVCRSRDVLTTGEWWKKPMVEKGWA
jgi:hypothetical protein